MIVMAAKAVSRAMTVLPAVLPMISPIWTPGETAMVVTMFVSTASRPTMGRTQRSAQI